MKKPRRLILSGIATGLAVLALPAAASASTLADPTSLTFPERQVASESDPQTVTVLVFCTAPGMPPTCLVNDLFTPNPTFTGANPGDFNQTNDCGAGRANPNGVAPGVCQFTIRFKPTASGARTATLVLGTNTTGSPPPPISLAGTAVPSGQRAAALKKCKKKKTKKKRKKCRAKANLLPE